MLCFRCGSPVSDTATSCANCGQDLSGSARPDPASFSELQKKLRQTGGEWARPSVYQPGNVVRDRYEIRDIVGEGGLGTVYRVLDQEVEVEVALKVIAPEVLPDEAARVHCLDGLEPIRDLVHENVVRTFDVDRDGERCFYVMQFLEGLSLRKIMKLRREKAQRFTVNEVEPIYAQLCRALGESSRRTPHGGVKPENVIILPDLLKITDFGLATALPRAAYLAAQRSSIGAWSYVAPEVREGAVFDSRADVYSVAVILVELLSGGPWEDGRVVEDLEGAPAAFARVLQRAVSVDPAKRQTHAGQLGEELTAALTGKRPRNTLPYGSRANPDAAATREVVRREEPTREAPSPDATDAAKTTVARETPTAEKALNEGTGLTHQLDLDDIEFGSQRARLEHAIRGESDLDDELLLRPPGERVDSRPEPAPDEAAPATPPSERTEKVALSDLPGNAADAPESDSGRAADGRPAGVESGTIEGTQQVSLDMIMPHDEEEEPEAAVLVEAEEAATGRVRRLSQGAIAAAAAASTDAPAKTKSDREARARDALQAFDFEATLQDKVESAAHINVAPSKAEPEEHPSEPRIEDASAPFGRIEPPRLSTPGGALPGIAPELLGRDLVPRPLVDSPEVTLSVQRPARAKAKPKSKALPAAVLSFVLVLIAGTVGVVYWVHRSNQEELERKRILEQELLTRIKPDLRKPALAARKPDKAPAKVAPAAGSAKTPVVGPEPKAPKQPQGLAVATKEPTEPKDPKVKVAKEPKQPKEPKVKVAKEPKQPKEPKVKVAKVDNKEPKEAEGGAGEKKCPPGMRYMGGRGGEYCIDRYEYPGRGRMPTQGLALAAARASCKARGQRLCTAKEWLRSCGALFPYGKTYDPEACNTGKGKVAASGSRKKCHSRFGVYDLSGNVSEWVDEGVAMGGDASSEQGHASCPARSGAGAMTGFRCCSDPEWD